MADYSLAILLPLVTIVLAVEGRALQFRVSPMTPVGAADFLLTHHVHGRLLNTYGQGGYLIWRLWPQLQVFTDGRALNESVTNDGIRMIYAADDSNGKSAEDLLKQYDIDVIVMDCFEPISGNVYYLPAALADPEQKEWKLIYRDERDLIYMRHPPPDVQPLNSLDGLGGMEQQCMFLVENGAPACSRGMADVFTRIGDYTREQKWNDIRVNAHVE
jgi:hypothetical protein